MKKLLLSLALTFVGAGFAFAEDAETTDTSSVEVYKLQFGSAYNSGKVGNYTTSWSATVSDVKWNLANFNNNNNGWTFIRCGSKSSDSTATIVNDAAFSHKVNKVVINMQMTSTGYTVDDAYVEIFSSITDDAVAEAKDSISIKDAVNALSTSETDVTVTLPELVADKFIKITLKTLKNKNGMFQVNTVTYYGEKDSSVVEKSEANVSFATTSYSVNLSEAADFQSPKATTASDGTLKYSSSKTSVATVDEATGEVTIKGAGETVITASVDATDNYLSGSASYTLTVVDDTPAPEGTFDFTTCNGITFYDENGEKAFARPATSGDFTFTSMEKDGVKIDVTSGSTATRIFNSNGNLTLRIYKSGTLTFTCTQANKCFKSITFVGANSFGVDNGSLDGYVWSPVAAEVEEEEEEATTDEPAAADEEGDDDASAEGNTGVATAEYTTVVFTANASNTITSISFELNDATAVETIEAEENVAPVYYNLQGVRVANPEKGIYIRVSGNKATKIAK